jgi:hypothetical protein
MHTIQLDDNNKYWQVFEDGIVKTSFNTQAEAEYWCSENSIEYTVIAPQA